MSQIEYRLRKVDITIGDQPLTIECLSDLDQTIDSLFAILERNGNPALLEELCPYFGVIWPSARALCQRLVESADLLKNKTVLEVGCGLALPSLFCARIGAEVTATDFHPEVPNFLRRNLLLNKIENVTFIQTDWSKEGAQAPLLGKFDWVIGSDILYEKSHPGSVAQMLARHCAPGGKILLADPGRPYLQAFSDEMRKQGFREETQIVAAPDSKSPGGTKEIFLLSFCR